MLFCIAQTHYLLIIFNIILFNKLLFLKYLLLFCCCCLLLFCEAQITQPSAGTRAGAYGNGSNNLIAYTANTAALGKIKSFAAGLYGEKRFLLQALSAYQMAVALPAGSGVFGLDARYAGSALYNRSKVGLAYARNLNSALSIGVQFNYHHYHIAGYGNAGAVNVEGGVILHVSESLQVGAYVYNPTGSALIKSDAEKLPAVYSAGLGYTPSKNLLLTAEIIKETTEPVNLHAGLQYQFAEQFTAKAGLLTATSEFYLGAGFGFHRLGFEALATVHPQLGVTPGFMITYNSRP